MDILEVAIKKLLIQSEISRKDKKIISSKKLLKLE